MEMRFFTIPIQDDGRAAEALNRFLRASRVAAVERHLVQDGANLECARLVVAFFLYLSFAMNGRTTGTGETGKKERER
jgi:hypothetical protein